MNNLNPKLTIAPFAVQRKNAEQCKQFIESVMNDGIVKIRFLAPENPNIGAITVNVTQQADGTYVLNRIREDGTIDYTATSRYKN